MTLNSETQGSRRGRLVWISQENLLIMTAVFVASHAIIRRNLKWLLTRRSPITRYMPNKWDIPGGTVEAGESPEEAVLREVREETALEIKLGRVLYVHNNLSQYPGRQTFQMVFLSDWLTGEIELAPAEHQDYKWVSSNEIRGFDLIGFLAGFAKSQAFPPDMAEII